MFIVGLVGELLDGGSGSIDHTSVKTKVEHAKDSGKHGPDQGAGHSDHHDRDGVTRCIKLVTPLLVCNNIL